MKYLLFKSLDVFSRGGFLLTDNKQYLVELETDDILYSSDDNNIAIGISIYSDPLVVEIVDENGLVINKIFIEEEIVSELV